MFLSRELFINAFIDWSIMLPSWSGTYSGAHFGLVQTLKNCSKNTKRMLRIVPVIDFHYLPCLSIGSCRRSRGPLWLLHGYVVVFSLNRYGSQSWRPDPPAPLLRSVVSYRLPCRLTPLSTGTVGIRVASLWHIRGTRKAHTEKPQSWCWPPPPPPPFAVAHPRNKKGPFRQNTVLLLAAASPPPTLAGLRFCTVPALVDHPLRGLWPVYDKREDSM